MGGTSLPPRKEQDMEKVKAFWIASNLHCVFINPKTNNPVTRRIYGADFEKRNGFIIFDGNQIQVDFYF